MVKYVNLIFKYMGYMEVTVISEIDAKTLLDILWNRDY